MKKEFGAAEALTFLTPMTAAADHHDPVRHRSGRSGGDGPAQAQAGLSPLF